METGLEKEQSVLSGIRQFITFHVAGRFFGVNILDVKEISSETEFTPVFHAPEEVKGYVNIRGRIHLVLDLRHLLGFETGGPQQNSRVVLFKQETGESFGVLVDDVGDVVKVDESQIEDRRKKEEQAFDEAERRKYDTDLSLGICRLEGKLLVILNAVNFLKNIEF